MGRGCSLDSGAQVQVQLHWVTRSLESDEFGGVEEAEPTDWGWCVWAVGDTTCPLPVWFVVEQLSVTLMGPNAKGMWGMSEAMYEELAVAMQHDPRAAVLQDDMAMEIAAVADAEEAGLAVGAADASGATLDCQELQFQDSDVDADDDL